MPFAGVQVAVVLDEVKAAQRVEALVGASEIGTGLDHRHAGIAQQVYRPPHRAVHRNRHRHAAVGVDRPGDPQAARIARPRRRAAARERAAVTGGGLLAEFDRPLADRPARRRAEDGTPGETHVVDGAAHRPDHRQRIECVRAHLQRRIGNRARAQADDAAEAGRIAQAGRQIRAVGDHRHVAGQRDRRAARRTARRAIERVGIAGHAEQRVEGLRTGRELGRVRLAEQHRVGVEQALDDRIVDGGHVFGVDRRTERGAQARGAMGVLRDVGQPGELTHRVTGVHRRRQPLGPGQHVVTAHQRRQRVVDRVVFGDRGQGARYRFHRCRGALRKRHELLTDGVHRASLMGEGACIDVRQGITARSVLGVASTIIAR